MADFNPKTIKGNIGGVYFTKTKEAVDPFNLTKYNPNTNQNIILFYLEDGVENNIVTVNFAPKDSSMPKKGWTSHDFPAIFRGYVDHTVNGEAIPRTFAQYLALVPTLVTDLNLNNKKPLSFNATVIQQSGVNLLGSFNTLQDLINAHTPTESLHDNDAIAYVYENEQNGYYKVYFSSGSSTWYWGLYDGAISTSLDEVQYNLTGLQVQGGFRNPAPIVPLQDEQYRIIWQHLNELYAQYSEVEGELGDLEQELIELNTVVVKSISKTDTNTVSIGLTRVDNNVDIHAVVNVANNSYNLLKVVSGGLEVDRYDIINEITFEINNTNSSLRQAIDNIVDNKISVHNNDNQTHQDIRVDIANLQKNKVDKVAGKGLSSNDFTTTEKNKLASIEAGAEVNPTASEIKTLYESNANTNAFTDTEKSQVSGMYNDNYFKGVSLNSTNYVITFTRRDNSTVTIDLPLESVVVSGAYEDDKIILTLQNGSTIEIPLGDLIDGLMSAPSTNKGETTNKTLTYGGTFKVLEIDTNGTITERVMTLPALPTKAQVGLGNVDNTSDLNKPISTATQTALNDKVDKVAGKGLSTNDYTTADKNLVATITNKANTTDVNNGLALKVNIAGNVTITGTKDFTGTLLYDGEEVATIQDLSTVFRYKGSVETYTDLPTSGQQVGDVYNVNDTGKNYAWSGTLWDDLGGTVDLSIYATKTELTSALSGKVDKVAGKQLSTEDFTTAEKNKLSGIETGAQVNTVTSVAGRTGAVVLTKSDVGLGNVDNTSDLNKPISTATQTALDKKADKTELFSGSYNDLTDKPTLFSGSYNDLTNKPTIPTKTSQLTNDSGFATETYVNNKVASVYKYKGSVETFADLPTTNRNVGDVYDVKDTGMNYAWNGTEWDALGTVVDLSIYATKTELTSGLSGKVDKVAGKQLSTEDFTTAEKTKLSGIATNAQVNVLEGVQLNGTDVAISSKKSNIVVNKTTVGLGNVPNVDTTNPANITQNATHRFVTDTEKATWNGKQNALGFTPENVTNKVTAITSASTDTQYPTAKAVYDMIGDIESVIDSILGV